MAKKKTTTKKTKAETHVAWFGLLSAIGEIAYISMVASFMWSAGNFFPMPESQIFGMVLMLTLFVFSAVMSGLIVLGYPIYIAMKGDIKKAMILIVWTSFFLLSAFIIGLGLGTYMFA
jgi:hypothetical protein